MFPNLTSIVKGDVRDSRINNTSSSVSQCSEKRVVRCYQGLVLIIAQAAMDINTLATSEDSTGAKTAMQDPEPVVIPLDSDVVINIRDGSTELGSRLVV